MKKVSRGALFFTGVVHACTKSEQGIQTNKQGIQKYFQTEFPILSTLKNYLHVNVWFF